MNQTEIEELIAAKAPRYVEAALYGVFDGGRYHSFDRSNAYEAVRHRYENYGRHDPLMIIAENPFEAQMIANYLAMRQSRFYKGEHDLSIKLDRLLAQQLGEKIKHLDSIASTEVPTHLNHYIHDRGLAWHMGEPQAGKLYWLNQKMLKPFDGNWPEPSSIYDPLWATLQHQLFEQFARRIMDQLDNRLKAEKIKHYPQYLKTLDVSSIEFAWYELITRELHFPTTLSAELFLGTYEQANVYSAIILRKVGIISKYPKKVFRNANGQLHNLRGAAVEWGSSFEETEFDGYYINGKNLPSSLWTTKINREMFLNEKNAEIRAGMYELLGLKQMMEMFAAQEIDRKVIAHLNGDEEIITLLKTRETFPEIKNQPFAWITMVCPSTGTTYLQGVAPHFTNALEAVASLSMFKPEDYKFNLRS